MKFSAVLARAFAVGSLAGLLVLSACATRGGSVPYDVAEFGAPDLQTVAVPTGPHRIGPMDRLAITVFQEEELSGEFRVDSTGRIDFPLLGPVDAQGRTPDELSQQIRDRLAQQYVRDPRVQVAIAEAAVQTVSVEGAVGQSGVYPIAGPTTLLRAVAMARGTTRDANDARVIIFRTIDGQRMAAAFDLRSIRRAESEDPPIYGNDVVVVPGSGSRAWFRDIISTLPILGIFRPFG